MNFVIHPDAVAFAKGVLKVMLCLYAAWGAWGAYRVILKLWSRFRAWWITRQNTSYVP